MILVAAVFIAIVEVHCAIILIVVHASILVAAEQFPGPSEEALDRYKPRTGRAESIGSGHSSMCLAFYYTAKTKL